MIKIFNAHLNEIFLPNIVLCRPHEIRSIRFVKCEFEIWEHPNVFFLSIINNTRVFFASSSQIICDLSVEASSEIKSFQSVYVCARNDSIASLRKRSPLYTGMPINTLVITCLSLFIPARFPILSVGAQCQVFFD